MSLGLFGQAPMLSKLYGDYTLNNICIGYFYYRYPGQAIPHFDDPFF